MIMLVTDVTPVIAAMLIGITTAMMVMIATMLLIAAMLVMATMIVVKCWTIAVVTPCVLPVAMLGDDQVGGGHGMTKMC